MFEKKYIFRFDEKITRDEVLDKVGEKFLENNIVKPTFIEAIKKREREFPTGLVLEGGTKTAISHSDDEHVIQDKIAIVISKEPVIFKSIEDVNKDVECNVFFVMALTKENKNDILVVMMDLFDENEEMITKFATMTDEEIFCLLYTSDAADE